MRWSARSRAPVSKCAPSSALTNTFQWLPQLRQGDVIRAPFADVRIATIDPDDIGAVAAAALTSEAHEGRAYRLSGPDSSSPRRTRAPRAVSVTVGYSAPLRASRLCPIS